MVQAADGKEGYLPKIAIKLRKDRDEFLYSVQPWDYFLNQKKLLSLDEKTLRNEVTEYARQYLGTQYRWGGKTIDGIDCSGIIFMSYFLSGMLIYRDAEIMEKYPVKKITLSQMKKGDLLFFPGHIAMYLGENQYIHSTAFKENFGCVINSLSPSDENYREDLVNMLEAVGSVFYSIIADNFLSQKIERQEIAMKAFVVDDEAWSADYLCELLSYNGIEVYGFTNPHEAYHQIAVHKPEVFFLDIEMPELSGLEFADILQTEEYDCEIVFSTAHNQYALEAFQVNALDYLIKPVRETALIKTLNKINKRLSKQAQVPSRQNRNRNIRISLFGNLSLYQAEDNVPLRFMTAKCSELLAYMLLSGRQREISKWKIIDDLWPEKNGEKGDINLRSTVCRLNKTFREQDIKITVKSIGKGYILEIKEEDLQIDAFQLEKFSMSGEEITGDNLSYCELLLENYHDMLLDKMETLWCDEFRNTYHSYYLKAAEKLLKYYSSYPANMHKSLKLMEQLFQYEPYNERLREKEIRLHYEAEGMLSAKKYYTNYKNMLKEELNITITKSLKEILKEA